MKKLTLIVLLCSLSSFLFAQNKLTDTKNFHQKSNQEQIYFLKSKNFYGKNTDSAIYYLNKTINIAIKHKNFHNLVRYYQLLAYLKITTGNFSGINDYKTALNYAFKTQSDSLIAQAYTRLANGYLKLNYLDSALTFYYKAYDIYQKQHNCFGLATVTGNIGLVNKVMGNYKYALNYYQKSLHLAQKCHLTNSIAWAYNSLGVIYTKMGMNDSSEFFYKKSAELYRKLGRFDKVANIYINFAHSYFYKHQYRQALKFLYKSLDFNKKINSVENLTIICTNMSETYLALNIIDSAKACIYKALNLAKKNNLNYRLLSVYDALIALYRKTKLYDSAFYYVDKYQHLRDSFFATQLTKQLNELQTKYELAAKEKEIKIQKLNLEKANLRSKLITILSASLFFIIIILSYMFNQKKLANKKLRKQKQQILEQKQELEQQAQQLKQAYDSISKQKDKIQARNQIITQINLQLTANLRNAKSIQQTFLPKADIINKFFDYFLIYKPLQIISGDVYWLSIPNENDQKKYFFIALIDCAGHGLSAALMTILGLRMLSEFIKEQKITSPALILSKMNELLNNIGKNASNTISNSMDVAILRLEKTDTNLNAVYAGAHLDMFYYNPQTKVLNIVKGLRQAVGNAKSPFSEQSFTTPLNSIFYMFTDGIIDQNNKDRRRFGSRRLYQLISSATEESLDKQKQIILAMLEQWMHFTVQRDDITLLGFKLKQSSE